MKCLNENCDADEIQKDDNFCYKCGHWTSKGFSFLKDKSNIEIMSNGATAKQSDRLSILASLLALLFIIFTIMLIVRGNNLFKPFFYLKKQAFNYIYGYNTSLMKTDNKYNRKNINTYEDAISIIKSDFNTQDLYCFNDFEVNSISARLKEKYSIPSISFCDMSIEEAMKVEKVFDRIYELFPNISGALTNVTISNSSSNSEYVARFQPMYQFVNINEDINNYNRVNKTQILLNSYYFLNEKIMSKPIESIVKNKKYVNGATWESTIAHEFGHYISFLTLLKKNKMSNITFETSDNTNKINDILTNYNNGSYSINLLTEALTNYNNKYNKKISLEEFAKSISDYACTKDENNKIIADETIAEAIHDYYLHGDNMRLGSKEIVSIVKSIL